MLYTACCKCFKTNKNLINKYITFNAPSTVDWRFICDFLVAECVWICKINEVIIVIAVLTQRNGVIRLWQERLLSSMASHVFIRHDVMTAWIISSGSVHSREDARWNCEPASRHTTVANATSHSARLASNPYHTRWCLCRTRRSCRKLKWTLLLRLKFIPAIFN